jgi:hypothetical protein
MQPSRLQSYVSPAFSVHRWLPISKATTETLGLLGHKEDIVCPAARVARRGLIAHIAPFTRIDLGFVPEMVAKGVPSPRIKVPQRTRRFCNFLEAELIRVSGCESLRILIHCSAEASVSYRESGAHCQHLQLCHPCCRVYTGGLMVSTRESRKTAQMCCICSACVFWRPGASELLT